MYPGDSMPTRKATPSLLQPLRLVNVIQTDSLDWNPGARVRQVTVTMTKVATDKATMSQAVSHWAFVFDCGLPTDEVEDPNCASECENVV